MDNFLANLYAEEQEKIAAADLGFFMDTLPTDELEEFLGLAKLGVGGPDTPELPSMMAEKYKKEKNTADSEVAKMQGEGPPDRNEASEEEKEKEKSASVDLLRYAMTKSAEEEEEEEGKTHTKSLYRRLGESRRAGGSKGVDPIEKESQGIGDVGMGGGMDGGMETTAAVKAEIVMRTMNVTAGAPPHIKLAAAKLAGRELAKVGADDKYNVGPEFSVRPKKRAGAKAEYRARIGVESDDYNRDVLGKGMGMGALKGSAIGAGGGALLGALTSAATRGKVPLGKALQFGAAGGATLGMPTGAVIGGGVGGHRAETKYLEDRGIRKRMFDRTRLTPEAADKYLTPKEKAKSEVISRLSPFTKEGADFGEFNVKPKGPAGVRAIHRARHGVESDDYNRNVLGKGVGLGALKGSAIGTAGGALLGAALMAASRGKGALNVPLGKALGQGALGGGGTGMSLGAMIGAGVGGRRAKTKYLEERGIKRRFGSGVQLTPEGAHKYMTPKEKAKAEVIGRLGKEAMIASFRTNPTSMDPDVAGEQGARAGRIIGGIGGIPLGAAIARGLGRKSRLIGGAGAAGAAVGALGGHFLGRSSGKKSAKLRRDQVMGDMRQRLEMIKQLRAENRPQ